MLKSNPLALALGCSALILAACGGDEGPTPPTRAFTMTVSPTSLSIQAGGAPGSVALSSLEADAASASANVSAAGTGTLNITITRSGGFTGSVALAVEGLPSGVTASAVTIAASASMGTITLNAGATAAVGTTTITVRGTGEGASPQTQQVQLAITAAPGFTLALAPAALSVVAGQSGSAQANITRTGAFTGAVNLTSSGAPAGITVAFTPASVTGGSAAIAVNVASSVAAGAYPITIQGSGTGVTNQTATLTVTVTAPATPTIALALNPATVSIQQGASGTSTLTLTRANFTGDVVLTSSGAPAGMTVAFNPATLTGTTLTSAISVTVGAAVAAGNYAITVQGAGTGVTNATTTLTVTVTAAAGSIVLTTNPAALSLQQGQSGSTTVTIARSNFTGTVTLTSSGAPTGVTVTFNPASTTGASSTATVAVGAAVAAGTYQITLQGAGTGVANATVALSLTVTASGGGSGNVTLTFCQQSGIPLWVGFSNNGGAWTQASGTNNVYSFTINTRGIIAYVLPSGNSTQLNVIYGTQAELTAHGAGLCLSTAPTKTINVTVNGVNAGEIGNVSMSGGAGAVIGGIGGNTVQLNNVVDGPRDLMGVRGALAGNAITPNSIVIQRDLNIPNNGSATIDFATGVAPVSRTVTIANLGAQEATFLGNFLSKNLTAANLSLSAPGTSLTRTWFGVPDANTVAGDFHTQIVIATNAGSTSGPSRAIVVYNRLATNATLTLPVAITTPPMVTVASSSPYVTINSSWAVQAPYNQFWS
ncbi:MAG: beta strand repeat-containing protein, partial [Gemmatimonadaceae bacterium]